MRQARTMLRLAPLLAALPLAAAAQVLSNPYGAPIPADAARKAVVAALAEGKKNGWQVAAAVVDPGGALVAFERIDGTQSASSNVSVEKARTAAMYRRPSKAFEDAIVAGRTAVLGLPGAVPLEGGIPIVIDGKIVGAIGVSGGTSQQDGVCAKAGVDALGGTKP